MSTTVAGPWARLLALNGDLLLNSLDGLTSDQASTPVTPGGNTVGFLVAHLVDSRHFIARLVGAPMANPVEQALAGAKSWADVRELPALPVLRTAWLDVSRHLDHALAACDRARLDAPCEQRFPGSDGTLEGALAFLVQHDSYHLGQIALLRRQHGLGAMSYRRGALAAEGGVVPKGSDRERKGAE
jgi:uncharacterized damage-inducible protein DinB